MSKKLTKDDMIKRLIRALDDLLESTDLNLDEQDDTTDKAIDYARKQLILAEKNGFDTPYKTQPFEHKPFKLE